MPALSIIRSGSPPLLVAHVLPVTGTGPTESGEFVFEVLAANVAGLGSMVGQRNLYSMDALFWGELISLEPCTSTVPGLALMRDRPTLRGVMRVTIDDTEVARQ